MNYVEYGKENNQVIILLHGGGLSWWNYRSVAEMLQYEYRVILPILDGHAASDRGFTSIEDNAAEIIEFIDEQFDGSVLLLGGLSLGGQILIEILSQRKDICQYAFVESALVIPSKIMCSLIKPAFGSCYGLIRYKWFSKLQFKSLRMKPELFEDYFRDTCGILKKNMIAFLQANSSYSIKESLGNCNAKVYILVGEKENRAMRHSANIMNENIRGSLLHVLPQMYHGEFSLHYVNDYVNWILQIVKKK